MAAGKMHADEVETDAALVRRLLEDQFPNWAGLPIEPIQPWGTDNAIYRLGNDMAVRLPRIHWATGQVAKEAAWLPKLAPHLPLAIPVPLAVGQPAEGYPWEWCVSPWLDGENATPERLHHPVEAANDLAAFLTALHQIDTTGGPLAGRRNFLRGVPLSIRDDATRAAIAALEGTIDAAAATAAWEVALAAPEWHGPPVWLHGDLGPGNVLGREGRITAVIDFGCLGVGDPACDMVPAWTMFGGESREAFREALGMDDATWARGRGWALSSGLGALSHYMDTNPALVAQSRRAICEVLTEHQREAR